MPAPTVTSISPPTGISAGGTVLVIDGTNFTGATTVTVGGVSVTGMVVISATEIYGLAGAHAAGTVDVVVTTPSGTGTGTGLFTYAAPATPAYNLYLFDDCCHNWFSSDTGGTFREGATPGGPFTPPPDDTGQDPYGVGTLLDEWSDAQMAINDGDYLTICGFDFNYNGAFGILGLSLVAGQNLTYTLIDPEPGLPAFVANFNIQAPAVAGAITSKAQTILTCPNFYGGIDVPPGYPRLSIDGGINWRDVTGVPVNYIWSRAAFGANATTMYLKPSGDTFTGGISNAFIYKSTNSGTTWTQLVAGPDYHNLADGEAQMRLRCSADGQTIVMMCFDGNFWISKNGGTSWTNTDFVTAFSTGARGRYGDCSVTPDGNTIVATFEQTLNSGHWPAVFVSSNGGTSFTNISANIQYPASVGPPTGGAPGTIPTGCTQCNVSPDGLGIVVTFIYGDTGITEPDGLPGQVMYANVSTDGGSTFTLCSFDVDPYENGSAIGLFTGIYMTPFTFIPGPNPPFPTPKGGYIIERLDNRVWPTAEDCWCVDCGFTLARPAPNADLVILPAP
jgi:hypothetical protein